MSVYHTVRTKWAAKVIKVFCITKGGVFVLVIKIYVFFTNILWVGEKVVLLQP